MITYVVGDLFHSPAKALVNTVNTVGVMGKGIAKDFKVIFPEMFRDYQSLCEQRKLEIGRLHLWRGPHKWVLNFPTKKHWRYPSKPEYIEAGLKTFSQRFSDLSIATIAFPQLGCGHGELDWEKQVRPLMEKYLSRLPLEVFIHLYARDPYAVPEHRDIQATKRWLRAEPESLPFAEVWDDLCEVLERERDFAGLETGARFTVRRTNTPEEGFQIANDVTLFVPQTAVLDAWQHLRSVGFLAADGLTEGLDIHADKILALLGKLPYLKLAKVASKRDLGNENFTLAVQLVPRPAREQLSLRAFPELLSK